MGEIVRKRFHFYGWVQGVGFRYRACKGADSVGCTGWVRNDLDGSVCMEIQGTEEAINQVIQAIKRGRYVQIEKVKEKRIPLEEGEYSFREFYGRY